MRLRDALMFWNDKEEAARNGAGKARIAVGIMKDRFFHNTYNYMQNSTGCCYGHWKSDTLEHIIAYLFILFNELVIQSGIPVDEVHNEFMKIDEYRIWHERKVWEESGPIRDVYCGFEVKGLGEDQ